METQKINPFLNANATHSFFQKNNNMEGKVTPSMKQTILEKGLISYQTLDSYRTLVRNDALFLSNQSQPTLDQKQERRRVRLSCYVFIVLINCAACRNQWL